jgi:hypothetical protein
MVRTMSAERIHDWPAHTLASRRKTRGGVESWERLLPRPAGKLDFIAKPNFVRTYGPCKLDESRRF